MKASLNSGKGRFGAIHILRFSVHSLSLISFLSLDSNISWKLRTKRNLRSSKRKYRQQERILICLKFARKSWKPHWVNKQSVIPVLPAQRRIKLGKLKLASSDRHTMSSKVISELKKSMTQKIVDFTEIRDAKIHAENLSKSVISHE